MEVQVCFLQRDQGKAKILSWQNESGECSRAAKVPTLNECYVKSVNYVITGNSVHIAASLYLHWSVGLKFKANTAFKLRKQIYYNRL